MRAKPQPQELYRYFKGKLYQICCIAYHSETGEEMVVYQALYGDYRYYTRPLQMFLEEVDRQKYPEIKQLYRFERVEAAELAQKQMQPEAVDKSTEEYTEESIEEPIEESTEETLDAGVLEFLDARTYEEKLSILHGLKDDLTDSMIDIMSTAIDIDVKPGSIEGRYEEFKNCLLTLQHFECDRLR